MEATTVQSLKDLALHTVTKKKSTLKVFAMEGLMAAQTDEHLSTHRLSFCVSQKPFNNEQQYLDDLIEILYYVQTIYYSGYCDLESKCKSSDQRKDH